MNCGLRDELQRQATDALERVVILTRQQIDALKAGDQNRLLSLDKDLELTFGEKERTFGALRQHRTEHGC
jgi:hypothetical protein